MIVAPLALVRVDPANDGSWFAVNLAVLCALASLPAFAAGVAIAAAIARYTTWVGTVYAVDLVGAGVGAFAVVPALWLLPAR